MNFNTITKKQKIIITVSVVLVVGLSIAGYFFWKNAHVKKVTTYKDLTPQDKVDMLKKLSESEGDISDISQKEKVKSLQTLSKKVTGDSASLSDEDRVRMLQQIQSR